jgi:hypothetical protein
VEGLEWQSSIHITSGDHHDLTITHCLDSRVHGWLAGCRGMYNFVPWNLRRLSSVLSPHMRLTSLVRSYQAHHSACPSASQYSSARSQAARADPLGPFANDAGRQRRDQGARAVEWTLRSVARDHAMDLFKWAVTHSRGNHTNGGRLLTPSLPLTRRQRERAALTPERRKDA